MKPGFVVRHLYACSRPVVHWSSKPRLLAGMIVISVACLVILPRSHSNTTRAERPAAGEASMPALEGDKAIDHLKQQGTYNSLQEAMAAVKYEAKYQTQPRLAGLGAAYELSNRANNLLAYVTEGGIELTSLGGAAKPWRLGLKLTGFGFGTNLSSVSSGEVKASGNRVSIRKSAIRSPQSTIEEWYVNSARGIEQGFTVDARPATEDPVSSTDRLRLRMAVTGDLRGEVNEAGSNATFKRETDSVLVSYDKLFVTDAKGRALEARMKIEVGELVIEVEDEGAEYPLTIDPLFRELTKLTASDGAAGDEFGVSVAISGDTVVVGAGDDDVELNAQQGSAYVFARSGTTWTHQAQLTASDGAAGDKFGDSVAISGDTVVVGAKGEDVGTNGDQGSAYVFARSGTTWTQQAQLTASDGEAGDLFGTSVAISGDTVVVGAVLDDVGANAALGSAHVFVRSGVSWSQQAQLTASDGDQFGISVAISGDTVVVGAQLDDVGANTAQGSAYVFVRSGVSWSQQAQLTASDGALADFFGKSVAISGDTVVVGAVFDDVGANFDQGSAYVFVRSGSVWSQQQKLRASDGAAGDQFGFSVAISGDTVVVSAEFDDVTGISDQGSAYVFTRSGTTWARQQQLLSGDGAASDHFGQSVAISGDTVVVGAPHDNVGSPAIIDQGSAYLFVCNWTEQPKLTALDGGSPDNFGTSVALSNDTAVIGAMRHDVSALQQGAVYVFVRSGAGWSFQQRLIASDAAASDLFGTSVAISGNTIVVGAEFDDFVLNTEQGSAYVFTRSGTMWTQQQQLLAADGAAGDQFGGTVAISGDTIVVGAEFDDVSGNGNQGSAYVFARSGTTWTQQTPLRASDGAANDSFGNSVSISGDTVVVGATSDDVGFNSNQGSAYVFVRSGTTWSQQRQLFASDGAAGDNFGHSVSISGDTIAVGARTNDVDLNGDQGSVYVFTRGGATWTQQAQLTASDGAASDFFGTSVAISGDIIAVGARLDDVGTNTDQGSAYVFMRSGATWYEQQHLTASDGAASDDYGISVAINGNTIVVGAEFDDVGANANQGSAYIYFLGCNTAPAAATNNLSRQKGSPASTAAIATVNDTEDPIGYLSVTVAAAPSGITITGITNTNGVITASIAAACNPALGNNVVVLQVQDSDGGVTTATMLVNVTANTLPTLGAYNDTSVLASDSVNVTPSLAPFDNGSIVEFSATSATFAGILGAEPDSGIITIGNARPAGTHIITVTAIDNCGATISSGFLLTVTCQAITVNPSTIPAGTAGSIYTQVFTQTGGIAPVTFSLTGTLPAGMAFTAATATLSGTPTQAGSFPITVIASDKNSCAGSRSYTLSIGAPLALWNGSTSGDWRTAANWTPNAVPTTFHDVLLPAAGVTNEPTIGSSSSSINALTIQGGRILTINATRQLATASDLTSNGQIKGAGKLAFAGSTFTQNGTVSVASVEFAAGSHALTGGGAFASNIITVLGGANVSLTSDHSLSVIVINSGGMFDVTNQTLTLTGAGTAIFNSGTFNATSSTIIYQGVVAQVVTGNIAYNNLTINNPAGVSLAGDTTVNGLLSLATDLTTGSFTLTMPASGASTGAADVIGNVKRSGFATGGAALSFGNPQNTIQFNTGTAPVDVTGNLVRSTPAGFPANTVSRTYTITPTGGSAFTATLRLRYKDTELNGLNESTLELWRFNGSSWVSPAGAATRDTAQNFVEETGITAFSPWAIAGPSGPTEVKLISFDATGYDNGVMLEWQTGFEVDNLGFRIYRQEGGTRSLLNQELVAGSALVAGSRTVLTAGRTYAFWVDAKDAGKDSAFWLEDIDLNGTSTWHGPFFAKHVVGKPPAHSLAESLRQVGQTRADDSSHVAESFAALARPNQSTSSPVSLQQAGLASSRAVKIGVRRAGWYRVSQAELLTAGLGPKTDPRTLRLFVDGIELPIFVAGEEDGRFEANDAVEFYGRGLNTPSTDTRTYWLIGGAQPGLRINKAPVVNSYPSGESFAYTVERRDRTIYFAALKNGDDENFFGAVVTGSTLERRLTLNKLAQSARESATIEVSLQGVTNLAHQVSIGLNGSSIGQLFFNGQSKGQQKIEVPQALLREGENLVTLQSVNGLSDISLVDFIRITYQHSYRAENDSLSFTAKNGETATINGFSTKDIRIFDVTDERDVQEIGVTVEQTKDGYSATVTAPAASVSPGSGERKLLALTAETALPASNIKPNAPSSLRQSDNAADFVIISHASIVDSLKPLAELRSRQGLITGLADIEDIYDEFSFGEKSPQAIKDFLSYAAHSWKVRPRFVLFAGDASYDARDYLGLGNNDLVPTKLIDTSYLETANDDWFVDFNGDGVADLSIGRLPVRTAAEASIVVAKLIEYEQSTASNEIAVVADSNDGFDFEQAASSLRALVPPSIRVSEIFRSRTGDATARRQVLDAINRGQKIVNYTGHGSSNVWRGNLLTAADGQSLTNGDRLSLFVMMTCLNGYFHDAMNPSLAESLLKSSGGAVAVWASSGMTQPDGQAMMNRELFKLLFNGNPGNPRLGEAVLRAKSAVADSDVRRTWVLLGDPTMRLR